MSPRAQQLVARHLDEALMAEQVIHAELGRYAEFGDDDEVRAAFSVHAQQTGAYRERLAGRLRDLGASPSAPESSLGSVLNSTAAFVHAGKLMEERIAQNLIAGYTLESAASALLEVLVATAAAAGDSATEELARQIQAGARNAADKFFHFLPTRSKIAFNMLTVTEVDPSVETKTGEHRLLET